MTLDTAAGLARVGVPFLWLGAVLAIGYLEAGLSLQPGICQQAFRGLAAGEVLLAAVLTAAVAAAPSPLAVALVAGLWAVLGSQVVVLRPRLERVATGLLWHGPGHGAPAASAASPGSAGSPESAESVALHAAYRRGEVGKVVALAVLACLPLLG